MGQNRIRYDVEDSVAIATIKYMYKYIHRQPDKRKTKYALKYSHKQKRKKIIWIVDNDRR